MSHFTRIQTSIRDLATLQSVLTQLDVNWEKTTLPIRGYQNQTVNAELVIHQPNSTDIGFAFNGEEYELVADLETWDQPIPVERFIDKVNQQYARMTIHNSVKKMGFQIEEEWEMDDNSIELVVTRWD